MTDKGVVAKVTSGNPYQAAEALADLLESGGAYPGDVSDIYSLASSDSRVAFNFPLSGVAMAYLELHGLDEYAGTDERVREFIDAVINGSAFAKRANA